MCLIALAHKGNKIPKEGLENSYKINKDGCGYMINGVVPTIRKGFLSLDSMYASYEAEYESNPDREFALHLRKASVGGTGMNMTHPFHIGLTGALVHNGTIHGIGTAAGMSDTAMLCRILADVPKWQESPEAFEMVESFAGKSRLVVFQDGDVTIVNADGGTVVGDVWYSNESFKNSYAVNNNTNNVTK